MKTNKRFVLGFAVLMAAATLGHSQAPQIAGTFPEVGQSQTAPTTPDPSSPAAAKAPGAIRIGIALPKYEGGSPAAAEAARTVEQQLLAGPKIEVVKLSSMLPMQVMAEAKLKGCDYVWVTAFAQKKGGGFGGLRGLNSLRQMSSMIPGAGLARSAATLQTAMVASEVASLASGIQAKADVSFEYSLNTASGESVLKDVEKAKASADGQDVITPLIEQAATKIVTLAAK